MDATLDLDRVVRSPRLAARRRAVRRAQRRRRGRMVLGLLLVAGLVAGGIAVSRSLLFDLARIEVVGARAVDPAAVVDASRLEIGQSVLGIDLAAVAERVRRVHGVADARVERDGSLAVRITIVERAPAVEVRAGDRRWVLDAAGQPVLEGIDAEGRIPVVEIARGPGTGAVLPRGTTAGVLLIWEALPPPVQKQVTSFQPLEGGAFALRLGRAQIAFGPPERVEEKVAAIGMVLRRVADDGGTLLRLDVRSPTRPAATMA